MRTALLNRRQFAALAAGLAAGRLSAQPAPARRPLLADMHSHYGMFLPRLFGMDLAGTCARTA